MKNKLKVDNKVFKPTGTSDLLLEASLHYISKKDDILDLGCGSGIIGIKIAKTKKIKKKIFFSDISKFAVRNTKLNCENNKINYEIKIGSRLKPWLGRRFDLIVCDVSGIADDVARISPWYNKSIVNKAGKEGINNIINILKNFKKNLNPKGKLIFPLISLSNEDKVLFYLKRKFNKYRVLKTKYWPIPKRMYKSKKLLLNLDKHKKIKIFEKYGLIIFSTKIIMVKK
jgi:methylase of polypeptide subunit release factors|tara:strand:- start:2839 stop:3522 length:684 start_codon:yes stop_codon:yes gene_type:complete